jgi:hypothetical protein
VGVCLSEQCAFTHLRVRIERRDWRKEIIHTVFLVQLLNVSRKVTLPNDIVVKLVPIGSGGELWTGVLSQWVKKYAIKIKRYQIEKEEGRSCCEGIAQQWSYEISSVHVDSSTRRGDRHLARLQRGCVGYSISLVPDQPQLRRNQALAAKIRRAIERWAGFLIGWRKRIRALRGVPPNSSADAQAPCHQSMLEAAASQGGAPYPPTGLASDRPVEPQSGDAARHLKFPHQPSSRSGHPTLHAVSTTPTCAQPKGGRG